MISSDEAKYILKSNCFTEYIKEVPLLAAPEMIIASEIHAACDVPAFDNAAMDGYALKFIPGKNIYSVVSTIAAGDIPQLTLGDGEAVRIFTGAPLPINADTVVQQEVCSLTGTKVKINTPLFAKGSHVRKKGQQNHKGQLILEKGKKITVPMISFLASAGIKSVKVYFPPSVAIIVTGSEIVTDEQENNEFKIYDANGPGLLAALYKLNTTNAYLFHVPDNKPDIKKTINTALRNYDMIILSGGISVGDYDYVKEVLEDEGVVRLVYKIAQKPGKPFFAGKKKNKWIFALPGNPAAALTCFNQYVKPVILTMMGHPESHNDFRLMPLSSSYFKKPGLTFFLKAKTENNKVRILNGQDSFDLSAYTEANAYVELAPEKENYLPGDLVKVYNL